MRTKDIKLIQFPFIKGLKTCDIFYYAKRHLDISEYLPHYKVSRFPNRQWFSNLGKPSSHSVNSTHNLRRKI